MNHNVHYETSADKSCDIGTITASSPLPSPPEEARAITPGPNITTTEFQSVRNKQRPARDKVRTTQWARFRHSIVRRKVVKKTLHFEVYFLIASVAAINRMILRKPSTRSSRRQKALAFRISPSTSGVKVSPVTSAATRWMTDAPAMERGRSRPQTCQSIKSYCSSETDARPWVFSLCGAFRARHVAAPETGALRRIAAPASSVSIRVHPWLAARAIVT